MAMSEVSHGFSIVSVLAREASHISSLTATLLPPPPHYTCPGGDVKPGSLRRAITTPEHGGQHGITPHEHGRQRGITHTVSSMLGEHPKPLSPALQSLAHTTPQGSFIYCFNLIHVYCSIYPELIFYPA